MTRKLIRGRSKRSQLLLAGRDWHLFAWCPALGADSYGSTFRWRAGKGWRHLRVMMFQRGDRRRSRSHPHAGRFLARPTLTLLEVSHWRTIGGTQQRHGLKSYLRVKLSPGGREVEV